MKASRNHQPDNEPLHAIDEDRVNEHILGRMKTYICLNWFTPEQITELASCLLDWYPKEVTEVWNGR